MNDLEIPLPLEFVVEGTPVSLSGNTTAWKRSVKEAAIVALAEGAWLIDFPVHVTIFYFPEERMIGDLDNIIKPILDALNKVVYIDDHQIDRIVIQRFSAGGATSIDSPSPLLVAAMAGTKPVTYIAIERA